MQKCGHFANTHIHLYTQLNSNAWLIQNGIEFLIFCARLLLSASLRLSLIYSKFCIIMLRLCACMYATHLLCTLHLPHSSFAIRSAGGRLPMVGSADVWNWRADLMNCYAHVCAIYTQLSVCSVRPGTPSTLTHPAIAQLIGMSDCLSNLNRPWA